MVVPRCFNTETIRECRSIYESLLDEPKNILISMNGYSWLIRSAAGPSFVSVTPCEPFSPHGYGFEMGSFSMGSRCSLSGAFLDLLEIRAELPTSLSDVDADATAGVSL
jgi:hypothetical protein